MDTKNANENLNEIIESYSSLTSLTQEEIFEKLGQYVRKDTLYPIDQICKYIRENSQSSFDNDKDYKDYKDFIFDKVEENILSRVNKADENERMLVASHFSTFEKNANPAIERFKANCLQANDIEKLTKKICLVTNEGTKNKRYCLQEILSVAINETKPENTENRSISRYQGLLFAFVLNMSAQTAEDIILKKALVQQGFNTKHPIDAMCYIALSQKTNKYLTFLRLFECFKKQTIKKPKKTVKNIKTNYTEDRIEVEDLSTASEEQIENAVKKIISHLYFDINSAEIQKLFAEKSSVKGAKLLEFCLDKSNSNRVDCLSSNSVSAYKIFKDNFDILEFETEEELCANYNECEHKLNKINDKLKELRAKALKVENWKEQKFIQESLYDEFVNDNDSKIKSLEVEQKKKLQLRNKISSEGIDKQNEENSEYIDFELGEKMNKAEYSKGKVRGMFGEYVLTSDRINKIIEKSTPVKRDDIITSSFYNFSILHSADYSDSDFKQRFNAFEERTNNDLLECGYMPLYYPNLYEFVLAVLAATKSPDEFFRKLTAAVAAEENKE